MRKIDFINRLAIQAIIAMVLTEWFWSNSYIWDEFAPYVIAAAFGIDVGWKIGNKIKCFIKKHFRYEK